MVSVDAEATVADLKKKIHDTKGAAFEPALLKLVHAGKILVDDSGLAAAGVKDGGFVVCMVSKVKVGWMQVSEESSTPVCFNRVARPRTHRCDCLPPLQPLRCCSRPLLHPLLSLRPHPLPLLLHPLFLLRRLLRLPLHPLLHPLLLLHPRGRLLLVRFA